LLRHAIEDIAFEKTATGTIDGAELSAYAVSRVDMRASTRTMPEGCAIRIEPAGLLNCAGMLPGMWVATARQIAPVIFSDPSPGDR